jgi:hypothetical protein
MHSYHEGRLVSGHFQLNRRRGTQPERLLARNIHRLQTYTQLADDRSRLHADQDLERGWKVRRLNNATRLDPGL